MSRLKLKNSNLYLYVDDLETVHKIADARRTHFAVLVRQIIHEYVVKHKKEIDGE